MVASLRHFECVDYQPCWQAMRQLTDQRTPDTADELWVLEHPAVFTLGQAGKPEHVLNPGDIPVINTDRGGQVTYHGPGQTVIYLLLDIRRLGIGARDLVTRIETAVVNFLHDQGIAAAPRADAPGVYVDGAKIASLGLRIRRGASYHGLALNRDMDLSPWQRINPCGHIGQPMTTLALQQVHLSRDQVESQLVRHLCQQLALETMPKAPPAWYAKRT